VGVGVGVGEAGVGVLLAGFGRFGLTGAGSAPDGVNEASCGAALTWIGVTADGAAVVLLLEPALAIPKAAPNATTAAAAPIAASFPGVIRGTTSWASSSPG
jgi:hypothetical protein